MGVFQGLPPMPVCRAVSYRMQIVAGTNYLIKVRGQLFYFLLIFRIIIFFLFVMRLSIFSWSFYTKFLDSWLFFALYDFFPRQSSSTVKFEKEKSFAKIRYNFYLFC